MLNATLGKRRRPICQSSTRDFFRLFDLAAEFLISDAAADETFGNSNLADTTASELSPRLGLLNLPVNIPSAKF